MYARTWLNGEKNVKNGKTYDKPSKYASIKGSDIRNSHRCLKYMLCFIFLVYYNTCIEYSPYALHLGCLLLGC